MIDRHCAFLALATLASAALSPSAHAEVYLVGFKTVYVIPARDPYEEQRYAMDQAYATAYEATVGQEEADLRLVDDLAARHPRDTDLLDRMRDRIRDDIEENLDLAARHRDETLAGWYTAAPNVYEACPEMVAVYRRERPVNVVEVKFSKGHRSDTYALREPYRAHRIEPIEGMEYGHRLRKDEFQHMAFVPPAAAGARQPHVHFGGVPSHPSTEVHPGHPGGVEPPANPPGGHGGGHGGHGGGQGGTTPASTHPGGKHLEKHPEKSDSGKSGGRKSHDEDKGGKGEGKKKKGNG